MIRDICNILGLSWLRMAMNPPDRLTGHAVLHRERGVMSLFRSAFLAGVVGVLGIAATAPSDAAHDPLAALANAICASPDAAAIGTVLNTFGPSTHLVDADIAEAFGTAAFMGDLGRCANKQAIYDAFAAFKQGKQDGSLLDASFAMGHVQATPDGGTASPEFYQGSYASLGTAGDPPSGK